jgi:hypothetical protein
MGAAQPHQSPITALILGSMMMSRRSPRNSAVVASPRRKAWTRLAREAPCPMNNLSARDAALRTGGADYDNSKIFKQLIV